MSGGLSKLETWALALLGTAVIALAADLLILWPL